jgi:nucleotide-binding universal stress UspA family protein
MNAISRPAGNLYLVVGYDGSPPAIRALDAAARLVQGRTGSIDVVYVAHLPSIDMLSADAVAEMDENLAIVVGSSSHAMHRVVGSVAVGLARRSPVPLVVVP